MYMAICLVALCITSCGNKQETASEGAKKENVNKE